MRKKQLILVILLSLLSFVTFANVNAGQQLSELLNRYQTYQANFIQQTYSGKRQRAQQTSSGRVMMMRPGKFRWETVKPTKQIVIADGKTLWVYYVELAQATKQRISKRKGIDPAMLLTGQVSKLLRQFRIVRLPGKRVQFQLKPKQSGTAFQLVQMRFIDEKLAFIKVINDLGQTSTFQFSRIRLNEKLNPNLFEFKPPRGVDVLDN